MMPHMKGHHQFLPKDASTTLLTHEESPSFFRRPGEEEPPSEMPSLQIHNSNASFLPSVD